MNWKQKIVLLVGMIVFVLVGLFPPKYRTVHKIRYARLCTYWLMTGVVTAGLIITFKDKKDKKPKDEQKQ